MLLPVTTHTSGRVGKDVILTYRTVLTELCWGLLLGLLRSGIGGFNEQDWDFSMYTCVIGKDMHTVYNV